MAHIRKLALLLGCRLTSTRLTSTRLTIVSHRPPNSRCVSLDSSHYRVSPPNSRCVQLVPHFLEGGPRKPDDASSEAVVMQFGRVSKDGFNLDYQAPLSGLQAFGIALSVFTNPSAFG